MKKILMIFFIALTSACDTSPTIQKVFSYSISDVIANPSKFAKLKSFSLNGFVQSSFTILSKTEFELTDGVNYIVCISNNYSPAPNTNVTISGKLKITYRFNDKIGLLFIVDPN